MQDLLDDLRILKIEKDIRKKIYLKTKDQLILLEIKDILNKINYTNLKINRYF